MMGAMRLSDIAAVTAAQLRGDDITIDGVATDNRRVEAGDLFVALRGERFDGHEFVAAARDGGARGAVVQNWIDVGSDDFAQLVVADTRVALGQIAAANRAASAARVLAVTGSNGKTSCRAMIAAILAMRGPVLATDGNFNNEIGLPLTLLRIAPEHRYAVLELGASRAGDIAYLCQFARPDIVLLTNASGAHLEGFGDIETVVRTKGEILDDLPEDGAAIINFDSPWYETWSQRAAGARQVSFSLENTRADYHASDLGDPATMPQRFRLQCPDGAIDIALPWPGRHMVANALASAAAAMAAGATLDDVSRGLASLPQVAGRLTVHDVAGKRIIDDSYNANPASVRAAIDLLAQASGRRVLVLGAMAELGADSRRLHIEVAQYASDKGIEALLVVGPQAAAQAEAFGGHARAFSSNAAIIDALNAELAHGDVVLIKGSRSAAMEQVVAGVLAAAVGENNTGGDH